MIRDFHIKIILFIFLLIFIKLVIYFFGFFITSSLLNINRNYANNYMFIGEYNNNNNKIIQVFLFLELLVAI